MSNLIDECWINLSEWPFVRRHVERRLLERRTEAFPTLHSIRKASEYLAEQDGANFTYKEYALQLLQLASTTGHKNVRQLLYNGPGIQIAKRFSHDLLAAAAYTNHFPLVKSLVDTHLSIDTGTFGNPFDVAVQAGNYYVLATLLAIDLQKSVLSIDLRISMLRMAIEHADPQMVEYLLQSDWNPLKKYSGYIMLPKRSIDRGYGSMDISTLLYTPKVEVFNIVLTHLQSQALISLDNLLPRLLRSAIRNGWADMARHFILLGAPLSVTTPDSHLLENPLYYACGWGHVEVVQVLLELGAQICGSELRAAALHGHASIIKILLENGADVRTTAAIKCLYDAAKKGFLNIVQMLLDSGMDPNWGSTESLIGAVESEHTVMFQLLIQRGAKVDRVLLEATRKADAAGLESMSALLQQQQRLSSSSNLVLPNSQPSPQSISAILGASIIAAPSSDSRISIIKDKGQQVKVIT